MPPWDLEESDCLRKAEVGGERGLSAAALDFRWRRSDGLEEVLLML